MEYNSATKKTVSVDTQHLFWAKETRHQKKYMIPFIYVQFRRVLDLQTVANPIIDGLQRGLGIVAEDPREFSGMTELFYILIGVLVPYDWKLT